ncbi:lytic transglycosylase domain-containing protein [Oecophyllibacter saccharovorans]|uniref:Murein transglycosylase n=1 Tax=Oecophyllibacter saccharovorans TaxID=2558360 RepID=A0A506ULA4_9PROT|nr:lytic transglycosylase domain-containing protein [Oecophyllibacter saccharovorans]QDH15282.1 murein transglycosylase [Oecophyllibacter saccharovorans]TPW34116.1 murein transglycosylase [Oecophyllibacter saccharovorans]TPW36299.1 murein transglycosylase [Oecophyllibacter saccharovorans]
MTSFVPALPASFPVSGGLSLLGRHLQRFLALCLLAVVAACASQTGSNIPVLEEQAQYRAHARSYYAPPGPPSDPWGPYIHAASQRFDVPTQWIRAVIHQESGGHLYDRYGQLITSTPGAMGLMQLMPPAYDDMRNQFGLGPDPYDPRDNIMAGTAYIRQMYDIYGTPGFLAAYNDGPGNVDHYLRQNRALPRETRNYVAAIGPHIVGYYPVHRSQADLMVSQHDRTAQPPDGGYSGGAYGGGAYAGASYSGGDDSSAGDTQAPENTDSLNEGVLSGHSPQNVSAAWAARGYSASLPPSAPPVSSAPAYGGEQPSAPVSAVWAARGFKPTPVPPPAPAYTPPTPRYVAPHLSPTPVIRPAPPPPSQTDVLQEQNERPVRIRTIPLAQSPSPRRRVSDMPSVGNWSVQIGSYGSRQLASGVAQKVRQVAGSTVQQARTTIIPVQAGRHVLYRTRLTGLSQLQAQALCRKISHLSPCMPLSPHSRF